jgi:gamma-glutamylaminecyclotransferase
MNFVFVYGTLMDGYGNNRLLQNGNAKLVGKAITQPSFVMLASGLNGIPFVADVKEEREGHPSNYWLENASQIHGEVWRCDTDTLKTLDRLEGHPDWYKRERVKVDFISNNNTAPLEVWIYLMPMSESEFKSVNSYPILVRNGNFRTIRDSGVSRNTFAF